MKTKFILVGLLAFALGLLTMWLIMQQTTVKAFEEQYLINVLSDVNVAAQIRSDHPTELVAQIESDLPGYVLTISKDFRGLPRATNTLWIIEGYYEQSHAKVPPEIKGILEALPPRPHRKAPDQAATTGTNSAAGK